MVNLRFSVGYSVRYTNAKNIASSCGTRSRSTLVRNLYDLIHHIHNHADHSRFFSRSHAFGLESHAIGTVIHISLCI